MSDSNIKTIHGLVLVQCALLQAIVSSKSKNTEIAFEFSHQYFPIIQGLNKDKEPDKELISAVERAYKTISAQLPKNRVSSIS